MSSTDPANSSFEHEPVLTTEILEVFAPVPPGVVVDATVGGGGHAAAILHERDDVSILGFDRDPDALAAAATRLGAHGDRVDLVRGTFDMLGDEVTARGHDHLSGVLFDLGVSSPQLDRPERGFSYHGEGPLDMRMDPDLVRTAGSIVNDYAETDLADILRRYGDERFARRVATAIVAARPVCTTAQLAEVVRDAIPAATRRTGGHPAKRTFQALRIEVNDELTILADAIDQAVELLVSGGRCAVLSYHSGEDRIVKDRFRDLTERETAPPGFPVEVGPEPGYRPATRGAVRPPTEEIERNPRARSARLRAVERLGSTPVANSRGRLVAE